MYTLLGFKSFIGHSNKSGKDYDFVQLHTSIDLDDVTGTAVEVISVPGKKFRELKLQIGDKFIVTNHNEIIME